MVFFRKNLLGPTSNPAADKHKPGYADPDACHQARKAKRDSEGKDNRP
jgi:hypothetical protein